MKTTSLDLPQEEFAKLLDHSVELVLGKFVELETQNAYHSFSRNEIVQWFDEPIPMEEMDQKSLLQLVKEKVLDTATNNLGPNMYAYVMTGGTQMSIVAEMLAVTINQNMGKWHLAPAMTEIERRVIQWTGKLLGFNNNAAGVLVSGGSAANLAGLEIARNIFFEDQKIRQTGLFNMKPFIVYASNEVHGCVDKSVEELGIGSQQLRKIETNPDYTINLEALVTEIDADIEAGNTPFCLVGTAGTVNTGAIDDLAALASIADKYNLWFHVDGAYGGLAAITDSLREKYTGIDRADSIAIDFHKWLYQPFEAGCILVNDWSTLKRAYFKKASYLDTDLEDDNRLNFNEHYFQLSRNAKALKVWMSIKFYGLNAFKNMIQKDLDLTQYLSKTIDESSDFELMSNSPLAIACFRYKGHLDSESQIEEFNRQLIPALEKDGRVFITGTRLNETFVLRACLINHRMHPGTVDRLIMVIREVAENLRVNKSD